MIKSLMCTCHVSRIGFSYAAIKRAELSDFIFTLYTCDQRHATFYALRVELYKYAKVCSAY